MSFQQSGITSMLFTRLRQPALIAGVLVAGATMTAGSAQATAWKSSCTFGIAGECTGTSGAGWTTTNSPPPPVTAPGNPPLQLGDKLLNIVGYSFANGIGNPAPTGHFDFEWQDSDTPLDFGDDNWNMRTVFDNALSGLLPTPANDAVGSINYTLAIIGSSSTFKSVGVDSAHTGTGNSVTKTIPPSVSITTTDGSVAISPLSGTFVDVTDTYRVANTGGLNSFSNGFTQTSNLPVPGPLPLLGLGAALGFSRRLRNRIKGSKLV